MARSRAGASDRLRLRRPHAGCASSEAAASSILAKRKASGSKYACCQSSDQHSTSRAYISAHSRSCWRASACCQSRKIKSWCAVLSKAA
eukprot:10976348-Alexandrium_andersonii.AAC.1